MYCRSKYKYRVLKEYLPFRFWKEPMGFLPRYRMASAVSGSFVEFQAGIMELSAPPMGHIVDNSIETMSADSYPASPSSAYSSPGTYLPFPNKPLGFDVFDSSFSSGNFLSEIGPSVCNNFRALSSSRKYREIQ